jgi:hypothetical protein
MLIATAYLSPAASIINLNHCEVKVDLRALSQDISNLVALSCAEAIQKSAEIMSV